MTTLLEHLTELNERATKAPWAHQFVTCDGESEIVVFDENWDEPYPDLGSPVASGISDDDAALIAATRNAFPALRECVRALDRTQKALAILIDPANKNTHISTSVVWANCVEAETKARAAIAPFMEKVGSPKP